MTLFHCIRDALLGAAGIPIQHRWASVDSQVWAMPCRRPLSWVLLSEKRRAGTITDSEWTVLIGGELVTLMVELWTEQSRLPLLRFLDISSSLSFSSFSFLLW